jgi:hypothetical protein
MSVPFINIYVLFLPLEGYICHGSANKLEKLPSGITATFLLQLALAVGQMSPSANVNGLNVGGTNVLSTKLTSP